jgi:hypothetical protein
VSEIDVERTLREIQDQVQQSRPADGVRATPASSTAAPASAAALDRPPLGSASGAKYLLRRVLSLAGYWFSYGRATYAADLSGRVGDLDRRHAMHERRLQQLETEQVRLRQTVLQLTEKLELTDRARRAALLRLEAVEGAATGRRL